jgi:MFS transporter, DHA3 family, macrolide efflux protein
VLATSMLVALLPQIVLGPFIGPYIDRWNRKRIMIVADLSIALISLGLVVLFMTGTIAVWHIYCAMAARAVGQAFHFPAMQAAIPMIVPEKHLARAAGLTQMLQGLISIAAPPAGALLLGILSMQGVLAIDVITAVIAVGCLIPLAVPQPARTAGPSGSSAFREMMEGFRYIWRWQGLKILMVFSALFNLFLMPVFTLLPIFVTRYLGGDVVKLGWLEAGFGAGIIAGGLVLGAWGGFKKRMLTVLVGILVSSVAVGLLGFTSIEFYYLGIASGFLLGLGISMANAPLMAIFQSVVAKDMQGRIFSLIGSISAAATPLGLALAGPTADALGVRVIYYAAGIICLLMALVAAFIPGVMSLGQQETGPTPDPEAGPE